MATIDHPDTHRAELSPLVDLADRQFAVAAAAITLGAPLLAYLSGDLRALFYVHVALGAFWFGLDFFFKFVLGPALETAPDESAGAVNRALVPKIVVVAEPLSIGVVASGIGLAQRLGYWANPTIWLWAALGIATLMLLVGFGPLHWITTQMVVELASDQPDSEQLDSFFARSMRWGLLQTVFMLAIIGMMTGMRLGL